MELLVLTAAHSGVVTARTGPEPSDIALALFAAGALWFVRRAMRARFPQGLTASVARASHGAMQDDPLDRLEAVIAARRGADPVTSYVAALTAKGRSHLARKLGEEALETVIAALDDDAQALTAEAADLIFHLLVLLADAGVTLADLRAELARREGVSGHDEKAGRP